MPEDLSCLRVEEILPWLLNGSLEEDLAEQVRAHVAECVNCRQSLEETEQMGSAMAQHVPGADLVALAADQEPVSLPRHLLVEHLQHCADCRSELSLLQEGWSLVVESGDRTTTAASASALATWRRLALAASVLAVVLGAGWLWTALSPSGSRGGYGPVLNMPLVELVPETLVVRGEAVVAEVELSPGVRSVGLLLSTSPGTEYEEYRLEVRDPAGRKLWGGGGLELNPTGDFTLALPADLLGEGDLRLLVVSGRRGEVWSPAATYRIRAMR